MKNLIEEIEKLKNRGGWTNDEFYRCGVNDCVNLLNQYNLIAAPKQIKLSEIVKMLDGDDYIIKVSHNSVFSEVKVACIDDFGISPIKTAFKFDNKIFEILPTQFKNKKWLYTLLIAGTEIIDDMECDE